MEEKKFVIILSDIHMGTSLPTVWYQKEHHEKYLVTILDDIIAYANQIKEVILLGDIFEFSAYPPDIVPPTIEDIILDNPNVLGTRGKLRKALSALEGRMVFLPGDHDRYITQAELNKIKSIEGYTIKVHSGAYIPEYNPGILFTHGDEFSLLNVPYYSGNTPHLSIEYFLHRAIAYKQQVDQNDMSVKVWESTGHFGDCRLTDFIPELPLLIENCNKNNFGSEFINGIACLTNIPKYYPIKLNKEKSVTFNEIQELYEDYLNRISKSLNQNKLQIEELEDHINGNCLPAYMKNYLLENGIDCIVAGHSHMPNVSKYEGNRITYINTAFICPESRQLGLRGITYGLYSCSNCSVSFIQVKGSIVDCIINKTETADEPVKKFTFGWSVYNSAYEFFMTMQNGVLAKAEEFGIDIIQHDQKSNTIEMITGCIDLINKGIDALLISPYNPEGLPIIVASAKKADIPVIVIDVGTGGADVNAFIVSDSFGGGVLAAEYALKLVKEHSLTSKNVAIIKVENTSKYALRRGQAFKSVMIENGYNVVAELTANSLTEEAYQVMKAILISYANDLSVVFCENDRMALGAARAIAEVGKKGEIMVLGFDGESAAITAIKEGFMQGTIAQQPFKMGEIGVEIANSVLLGIPVTFDNWSNKEILMEVYLINEKGEAKTNII